jgi:hypothetical protein
MRCYLTLLLTLLIGATVGAQWGTVPTAAVPRLPDGRPNLGAPAPRTAANTPGLFRSLGARRPRPTAAPRVRRWRRPAAAQAARNARET